MLVTIVLLNYNNENDTIECLQSLNSVNPQNFDVVLVDNCSSDDSYCVLKNYLGKNTFNYDVEFIRSDSNLGFAGGNNIGIQIALKRNSEYVLLLNNDTLVEPDFLKVLVDKCCGDVYMTTPKILYNSNRDMIWSAGGKIDKVRGLGATRNNKKRDKEEKDRTITFAPFCCVLFRSSIFKKLGLLDDSYFMYFEDADYCQKMNENKMKLLYSPGVRIYHKVSASSGGMHSPFYLEWMTRNRKKFVKKYFSFFQMFVFKIEVFIKLTIYHLKKDKIRVQAIKKGLAN